MREVPLREQRRGYACVPEVSEQLTEKGNRRDPGTSGILVCSLISVFCSLPSTREAACLGLGAGAAREGHLVDALAPRGDEGRGTLRKAEGRGERPVILGCPNGATHRFGGIMW